MGPSRESGFQFVIKSHFVIALVCLHNDMKLAKDTAKRATENVKLVYNIASNRVEKQW